MYFFVGHSAEKPIWKSRMSKSDVALQINGRFCVGSER